MFAIKTSACWQMQRRWVSLVQVTLADQPTMKTFTGTDKSASITYTVAVPAYGSITATVTITVGGNFVLDTFTSPASISFTNQASTVCHLSVLSMLTRAFRCCVLPLILLHTNCSHCAHMSIPRLSRPLCLSSS